jgi:hypothetical protein
MIYPIKDCTKHSCPTFNRFTVEKCGGCLDNGKFVDLTEGRRVAQLKAIEVGNGSHVLVEDEIFRVIS